MSIAWILIGILIGLVASRLDRRPFPQGGPATIVGAALGAFLGGGLLVTWSSPRADTDVVSLLASAIGALLLVAMVRWAGRSGGSKVPG